MVSKNLNASQKATPVFQMIFKKRVEDFVERNRDAFRAKGEDVDNYEADGFERFTEYYEELKPFLDEDLSDPF